MNLESGGQLIAARSALEQTYLDAAMPHVMWFMNRVRAAALDGSFNIAGTRALWATTLDRVRAGSPATADWLAESELPDRVIGATSATLADAAGMGAKLAPAALDTALGLARTTADGAAFGRIIGPDGAYNWQSTTEGAARTAATADFGLDMLEQGREEGYTHKRWQTRFDQKVRDTHAAADRQTIPLEENFIVGGATLRFPADPLCDVVGEVANCRCVLTLVRFGDRDWDFPEGVEPWNNPYPGP